MLRLITRRMDRNESGQALPLVVLCLFVLIGFVAMSIDVGRLVWARTQMQAAVDAAALAAAQSMPNEIEAKDVARDYWLDNSGFIQSQGTNIWFNIDDDTETVFPPGNKAIRVAASADIPTWFAKFFGVPKWHVSAEGWAESQVLDISVVLDVSGSMCFDSFRQVENSIAYQMSPGRNSPVGGARPVLAQAITSTTQTTIYLNDVSIFNSTNAATNRSNFGTTWNTTSRYHEIPTGTAAGNNVTTANLRRGIIMINNEIMRITAVNAASNTLTVERARQNENADVPSVATTHAVGSEIWANRTGYSSTNDYCELASRFQANLAVNGPHQPFDAANDAAKFFVDLFDPAYDKLGTATFSNQGQVNQFLSSSFPTVKTSIEEVFFPAGGTNIAHGLAVGRQILDGAGKRSNAVRVIVLLTDGAPTYYCGNTTYQASAYNNQSCSQGSSSTAGGPSYVHAYNEAARASQGNIIIFTIGLGNQVDHNFLRRVADGGVAGGGPCQQNQDTGCRYIAAPTTAQLDEAFQTIAEMTHIALVK